MAWRPRTRAEHVGQLNRSGRASLVVAVEAASFGDLPDIPVPGPLHRPRCRAVHVERTVATPAVIMLEVVAEEPSQMPLAKDDGVVQALATDAPDCPLGKGLTKTRTFRQPVQLRDSHAQKRRSGTSMCARAWRALIHGELVAQCEDLKLQGGSRSEAGAERGDESDEDCLHEAASYPLSGTRRESLTSARAPPNSRDAGRFGILGVTPQKWWRKLTFAVGGSQCRDLGAFHIRGPPRDSCGAPEGARCGPRGDPPAARREPGASRPGGAAQGAEGKAGDRPVATHPEEAVQTTRPAKAEAGWAVAD